MPDQDLDVLEADRGGRRLRVRVTMLDPECNPPLDRSFFVRMFVTLAGTLDTPAPWLQALPESDPRAAAFVDPNAWRFISHYDELPQEAEHIHLYDVFVVDPVWLTGISPGLHANSADYSSSADPVTPEEAAVVPDIRRGEIVDALAVRGIAWTTFSSDGSLFALMPEDGEEVWVGDSTSLAEVGHHQVPGAFRCVFVPGTEVLVFDSGQPALHARTGRRTPRETLLPAWPYADDALLPWNCASSDGSLRVMEDDSRAGALLLTDARQNVLRELGKGFDPQIQPNGHLVVAHWKGALKVWDTGSASDSTEPRTLPLRHESLGLALSPDGAYVVTSEGPYRHAYVRRVSDGGSVRYGASWHDRGPFDPGYPNWSPDGSTVVICYRARERHGIGRVEVCRIQT